MQHFSPNCWIWSSFHNCLNKGRTEGLPGSRPPPISPIRVPIHEEKQSQQIRMHYFLLSRETGAQIHEELPTKKLPACSSSQPSPQLYGQNRSLDGRVLPSGHDNTHVMTWSWLSAWQLWGGNHFQAHPCCRQNPVPCCCSTEVPTSCGLAGCLSAPRSHPLSWTHSPVHL